jgi:hypothetical protein
MAKSREDGLLDYKPQEGQDGITRAAEYLIWAAKNFPRRPVPLQYIVKFSLNEPKVPKEDSKDVLTFRDNKLRRVRSKLMKEYRRGMVYHPGIGHRATVDDDDIVENVMEKKRKRVQSAISSMSETEAMVRKDDIRSARVRDRFEDLSDATRRLTSPAIQNRLAPPAKSPDDPSEET